MLAAMLLLAHLVDAFWLVAPAFRPTGFAVAWSDLLAVLALGGIWLALFMRTRDRCVGRRRFTAHRARAIGHA